MNSKGQVTIPAAIRNKLHLQANNKFEFMEAIDNHYAIELKDRMDTRINKERA